MSFLYPHMYHPIERQEGPTDIETIWLSYLPIHIGQDFSEKIAPDSKVSSTSSI